MLVDFEIISDTLSDWLDLTKAYSIFLQKWEFDIIVIKVQ